MLREKTEHRKELGSVLGLVNPVSVGAATERIERGFDRLPVLRGGKAGLEEACGCRTVTWRQGTDQLTKRKKKKERKRKKKRKKKREA